MIKYAFTVRDNKTDSFFDPIYFTHMSMAERAMVDCMNDATHVLGKHTEDFALYYLGEYDDSTGKHELQDAPQHVANLVDLKGA